ncbi:MAG: hypothetical protein A3F09_05820 [Chlamydiae bacterium RIFCSPHIGHO2_12_FULL_49_11]|nr:MAG: hypothetical protein A3F09_05820 [Chlamydiae bacterium RIFCSPHIGHO2_12_FULL_49_11]
MFRIISTASDIIGEAAAFMVDNPQEALFRATCVVYGIGCTVLFCQLNYGYARTVLYSEPFPQEQEICKKMFGASVAALGVQLYCMTTALSNSLSKWVVVTVA